MRDTTVYVVYVPHTAYVRVYTTERRAETHLEAIKRNGMLGFVLRTTLNQKEDEHESAE